ncbi:penicillin acylase family protein [Lewinella sp. 4G2]|uniref:penicillin acylase family protein n=1 Tax=Lewinella sp. 4G2 TaxID=1803372 RepID=UPI0007B48F69|nr:penicillin acylase family protein [Lewinella sp. 4G2]OAV42904.1 hypothetical protein A3850_016910 [Lewinella sp. 4G2]
MKLPALVLSILLLFLWVLVGSAEGIMGSPLPRLGTFFNPPTGFWTNAATADWTRGQISKVQLEHPLAKGTIFFDRRGVPHIFANTLSEASFLQGYVHAADRLWQMDVSTRATDGTLSAVLGDRTYARDLDQIRKGYRRSAQQEVDTIYQNFPEDAEQISAYSAGINTYINQLAPSDYPVEYKLLGHSPQKWSPYRTMLLLKGMSQALSSRFADAERAATVKTLSPDTYRLLYPDHSAGEEPVIPDASSVAQLPKSRKGQPQPVGRFSSNSEVKPQPLFSAPAAAPQNISAPSKPLLADLHTFPHAFTLMPPDPGNGSNNWAVNARLSNTGYPMLASDPHLTLTLPSIWHEIQIHLPEMNARGVSLPGSPGIMIGYNDHIAYGETNVGQDVTDWFKIEWTDESRTAYVLDGATVAAEIVRDTLFVKGREVEIIETPYTIFGPVPYTEGPYADHAMRYLGHVAVGGQQRKHSSVGTFLQLMRAEGHADYETALRGHVDPAQNFAYADRYDNIAMRPNGFFPVRSSGDGGRPYDGSVSANNWRGFIPFEQRPGQLNPRRGFVSSANQVTTGPAFPYPYTGKFAQYRGRYINRHLEREGVMNQRSMKELQLDSRSLLAEELTPLLLARLNRSQLSDDGKRLLRLVADWDYDYQGNSQATTVFERWKNRVFELTFDELKAEDRDFLLPGKRAWTQLIRKQPQHEIFDIVATTEFRETAATLVQRAFDEILEGLEGGEPEEWAVVRNSRVRHLGAIPGLGSDLITTAGGGTSPRVLRGGHGASWRMVVELGKYPRAWGAIPGGSSGHPGSEAYDNGLEDWTNGRYHELVRWRDWEEAENKSVGRWEFE